MSCDSTDQRRAHDHSVAAAAQLQAGKTFCVCDCSVVKTVIGKADMAVGTVNETNGDPLNSVKAMPAPKTVE